MQIASLHGEAPEAGAAQAQMLLRQAQANGASSEKGKIEKAGRDFESILLGSWLGDAEKSFAAAPGGPDEEGEDGGNGEQFMAMAMQQLAGTLVNAGGIGIGRMIVKTLEAAPAHAAAAPSGANRQK